MRAPLRLWPWTALFVPLYLSGNGSPVSVESMPQNYPFERPNHRPLNYPFERPISSFTWTKFEAPGNSIWTTHVTNLNAAMEGYDPVMSNPIERPDPGIRNQIFEPITRLDDGRVVLNSFVDKAREFLYCDSELTEKTFRNYNNYKAERSSTHKFSFGADISASGHFAAFSFEASAGLGRKEDSEESSIKKFFKETKGEIIEHKVQCITHAVSIALFEKPVFTHAFLAGLRSLHVAAMYPRLRACNETFRKFVSTYGTHYMGTTYLGAKLIFQKLFTSKLVDASSESERKKCVESSAYASVGPSFEALFSASASFKIASSKCDNSATSKSYFQENSINSESIISMGSLPIKNFEEWDKTVKDSPVPIYYELRKISSLFLSEWFNFIPLSDANSSEMLDGHAMYDFFENCSARYCKLMLDRECPAEEKGCGINSDCDGGIRECVEDLSTILGHRCVIKHGGVIIAGGIDDDSRHLTEVESLNTWELPSLPNAVHGFTLSVVGSKIYTCGGFYLETGETSNCYVLDRDASSPSWSRNTSVPKAIFYHSAAVVRAHIWYVSYSQLFDLNTVSSAFKTYNLPFHCSQYHRAVSNDTHSYVIGVGRSTDEIWVNTIRLSPEMWHKVATMSQGRSFHDCLWLNDSVYITGGDSNRKDVEVFNTITEKIWKTGALNFGRHGHRMMVLDGKPAVVAGIGTSDYLDNIETLNLETKTWSTNFRKLKKKRALFGLVQLIRD